MKKNRYIASVLYSLRDCWNKVEPVKINRVWAFGHNVIDSKVLFTCVTCCDRLFSDGDGVG